MISERLSAFNGIALPLPEKKILERQYLETNISENTLTAFNFMNVVPTDGRITWIIGTAQNRIPESMIRAATFALMVRKPKEIQSLDMSNNASGRSTYRFDHIVDKYNPNTVEHEQASAAQLILKANLSSWSAIYKTWEKTGARLSFYKQPNQKIKQKNLLMISLNPRRGVLNNIYGKLKEDKTAAIIADMDCDSVFALGSREHFSMNNESLSINALRGIAQKTEFIVEQRCVFLECSQKKINLVRHLKVRDEHSKLLDNESESIKNFYINCAKQLPAWEEVASKAADNLTLDDSERVALIQKSKRLDAGSYNASKQFMDEDIGETHGLLGRNDYVKAVYEKFSHFPDEVIGTYEAIYGIKPDGIDDEKFVIESAKNDYLKNAESFDFAYPELAVVNLKQEKSKDKLSMTY